MARSSRISRTGPTFVQRSRGVSASDKARYNQVDGTGRRRVLRPFIGLTADDEAAIVRVLEAGIDRNLGAQR